MEDRRRRSISGERQFTYYVGLALMVIGFVTFFSMFFTDGMSQAPIGMVLMIVGGVLQRVGLRGLAGSGVLLDPERARRDIEPWARMGGGVVKDALEEVGVAPRPPEPPSAKEDFEEMLRKLHRLHADGVLTDAEYEREKREILDRI